MVKITGDIDDLLDIIEDNKLYKYEKFDGEEIRYIKIKKHK